MVLISTVDSGELLEVVRRSLGKTSAPTTPTTIAKGLTGPFKTKAKVLAEMLEAEVAAGRLHKYGTSKTAKYWDRGPEQLAVSLALAKMARGPQTPSGLKTAFKGLSAERQKELLDVEIKAGRVFVHPALGAKSKAIKYGVTPANPGPYLAEALKKIREQATRLATFGIPVEKTLATACELLQDEGTSMPDVNHREPNFGDPHAAGTTSKSVREEPANRQESVESAGETIIRRMHELDPGARQGAAIAIPDLRKSLDFQFPSKESFDAAVLELVRRRQAFVHRHDLPESLPADVRDSLVTDGQGNYYAGISLAADPSATSLFDAE